MIWKQHQTYSSYFISENGDVRHFKSLKNRKSRLDKDGYMRLNVFHLGKIKTIKVHTLVAETFIPRPGKKEVINHKDGNKQNNNISNLEWVTPGENTIHSFINGLQPMCMPVAINGKMYYSKREAERQTGLKRHSL